MPDLTTTLQLLTVVLLAAGGYLVTLFKAGSEAAIKTSAEEAAKAAIQQLKWPAELARELQKSRGVERQELRFKSYGALWKELRPLALYGGKPIDKAAVADLSTKLSDWYFSDCGGLLLTPQARDFYFALQDLLRATAATAADWTVERPADSGTGFERPLFQSVLKAGRADGALAALDYVAAGALDDWQDKAPAHAAAWRQGLAAVAQAWPDLDTAQRFATLQQAGSILRTSLATDLESRAR